MYRRKRFIRRGRGRRPRRFARGKPSKKVRAYVKREIHRSIENKVYMQDLVGAVSGDNLGILTPSSSTLPQYFSLIPTISQSVGEMSRVGNKIRIKSSKVRIRMFLNGAAITTAVDAPMNIYYFVLNVKDTPALLASSDLNQLFYYYSAGQSTTQFLSGSLWAATHRVNTDYFNIIKTNYPNRPIKLGWSAYGTGGLLSNNDYKSYACFDINLGSGKGLNKVAHFSNASSTPLDYNAYLCIYIQKVNNDTTTVGWDPPYIVPTHMIEYEDA